MKTLKYILCVLLTLAPMSCQNPKIKKNQGSSMVDPAIKPYIDDFIAISKGKIKESDISKIPIGFDKLNGNTIGLCYRFMSGIKEIQIDTEFFEEAPFIKKKQLIFHELVHCVCNRGHDSEDGKYESFDKEFRFFEPNKMSGYFEDLCPKSIMHPEILNQVCLERRWEYYMKEMFNGCSVD